MPLLTIEMGKTGEEQLVGTGQNVSLGHLKCRFLLDGQVECLLGNWIGESGAQRSGVVWK